MTSSWLCRDDVDRERLLDMERRLKPVRAVTMGVLAIALLASAPWLGWWTLVPLALAAGLFQLADAKLLDAKRPEYVMFAAWAGSEVTIAIAVALSGGPHEATLGWLAIPVVTLSARFSLRGVMAGVAIAVALVFAVAFGVDASAVLHNPTVVIAPAATIITIAVLSTALMRSDVEHRSEAVIDPLTGMLNRKALDNRVGELAQQSEVTGAPVGIVVGDLDNFKNINDSLGHAVGDSVLKEVAYNLRRELRAFDLAYRLGGDEFLFLVPGGDETETRELADQLRHTVEKSMGEAVNLTMSLGIGVSPGGAIFDYQSVFAAADAAMYEAKQDGGNRVCSGMVIATETNGKGPMPEPFSAAFAD
jgi:diguanylate cyclase (GGDEF)-like protein